MKEYLIMLAGCIFVNNFVLVKFLGICPFLGVSKKLDSALGMSFAVIFVMVASSAATWPVYTYILKANNLEYLVTIVFIVIIASLVQLVEMLLKKYLPVLYRALGVYLPLITTNCCVLGITIINIDAEYSFIESIVNSFGAGIGFLLAMFLFAGVRSRVETSDIPEGLKGIPITLIAASLVSLSFMGFAGMIS